MRRLSAAARAPGWLPALLAVAAAAATLAAYSNFHNSFHFDDASVIVNNLYLRDLKNIPLFFRDGKTFSSVPANAAYRPLTAVSFALDWRWSRGANPFAFHVTQWTLHLLLGALIALLLSRALSLAGAAARAPVLALFGAALFCLHRANTETVNFLTLRSEILSGVGVAGSFVFYQYAPRWRRTFLWCLPAAAGAFAKESAIIFAPLFALYLLLFAEERGAPGWPTTAKNWLAAARLWGPPFLFGALFYMLQDRLAGAGFGAGWAAALAVLLLVAHAAGTYRRNRVWATEETLWRDVTEASPGNGGAWMNYGLIFMARADYARARSCFERAHALTPGYDILEINLAVLEGAQGHSVEAEKHFENAIALGPHASQAHFYFARWLHGEKRDSEAAAHLRRALQQSPADLDARRLLMSVYGALGDRAELCGLARETLQIAPGDASAAGAVASCPQVR